MGKTSLDAFMATCPELDTLKVKGRGKKSLDSFLEYVKATYPQLTTVTVVDDIETLVRDSNFAPIMLIEPNVGYGYSSAHAS